SLAEQLKSCFWILIKTSKPRARMQHKRRRHARRHHQRQRQGLLQQRLLCLRKALLIQILWKVSHAKKSELRLNKCWKKLLGKAFPRWPSESFAKNLKN